MKLKATAILAIIVSTILANPEWKRIAQTKSTIFNAVIKSDGADIEEGDVVGVFVDEECRMVATVKNDGLDYYIAGVINSEEQETATLKYWDSSEEKAINIDTTVTTIPHGEILNFPIRLKGETIITDAEKNIFGKKLSVYPTPFTNELKINSAEPIESITLVSQDGKIAGSGNINGDNQVIYRADIIPSGKYTLAVLLSSGEVINTDVIKK